MRRLRLVDRDTVELSNLHRQVLYTEADVGRPKVEVLAASLVARWPDLSVEIFDTRVEESSTATILRGCDAVLECTDDTQAKFLTSDFAASHGIYATIAAAIGRRGQWLTMVPGGPCYRCLFEAPPPAESLATCSVAGVLGSVTGQVGALAGLSLVRALRGQADPAIGALVRLSPRGLQTTPVTLAADCPCHAHAPRLPTRALTATRQLATALPDRE
jgi:molybdopterin/thiamine biosynthesis adenylyltransferase